MSAATSPASPSDWREVFALLDTALDIDPDARAPWLDALGAEQARLRPMLLGLLADRRAIEADGFLAVPAPLPRAPLTEPAMPAVIGPYRLLREIGQGGMATVWLAERADGLLERQVALKLPHASWGRGSFAERMARERSILASLTHPNIARLYDAGLADDGRPYLAMEYIDGQPIDVHAATRGASVRARVALIVQVARAVAHAHAQLVVHRDLKPSNILVDAQGQVHLLDFGIAKLIDPAQGQGQGQGQAQAQAEAEGAEPATLMLGRVLTPDYASPEQIRGEAIGTATDVYSLGIVAFELLAGTRPYRMKAGLGAAALAESIASVPIPAASKATTDVAWRRQLRGDLDAILQRALAKHSADRYATVEAFADDLERHLRSEPVRVRSASRRYVADRWVRAHKAETAIAVAVLLALVGGAYAQVLVVGALGAGAVVALWQRNRALQQAELARAALARGEQVKDFIASIFTQAVPRAGRGGPVAAADLLRAAARRIETDLANQPEVAAELAALIGASFNELGEMRAGLDWLAKVIGMCTREFGATHRLTLQSRLRQVEAANALGDLAITEAVLPALLQDLRSAVPPQPMLLTRGLRELASIEVMRGRETQAVDALTEAIALASLAAGDSSDEAITAQAELSNTFGWFARQAEALQAIAPAHANVLAKYGEQRPHPLLTLVQGCHAEALSKNQRPRDAAVLQRRVLTDQRALDIDDTHRVRTAMVVLGQALMNGGHFDEAFDLLAQSQAMQERLTGGAEQEGAVLWIWLALVCALRGDGEAALTHMARCDEIAGTTDQAGVMTSARESARALAQVTAGRHGDALRTADRILAHPPAPRGSIGVRLWRVRAMALRQTGALAEAIEAAGQARAAVTDACTALEHGLAQAEAGRCHAAAGDAAAAERCWREALSVWAAGQVDGSDVLTPVQTALTA